MCGRNTLFSNPEKIKKDLKVDVWKDESSYKPSYNLSPTQNSLILVKTNKRIIHPMRWGFGFDSKRRPIFNARAETLHIKPSFKDLIKKNRCIVLSDGFYEWKQEGNSKTPHFIQHQDHQILPMAGLCKWDIDAQGHRKLVFTIITKQARPSLKHIHHREPVMLNEEAVDPWISVNNTQSDPLSPLKSNIEGLVSFPVTNYVNTSSNDGEKCISQLN